MLKRPFLLGISLVVMAIGAVSFSLYAQGPAASSTVPITITVTVLGPQHSAGPPLKKEDLLVLTGKTRLPVTGWEKAEGQNPASGLQLAIAIDNSDSPFGVGKQIDDLAAFIESQARTTAVGLFHAVNGTVETAAPFSIDHDAVAKALRLPMESGGGSSSSVYLSLDSLLSRWRSAAAGRREVLLLSSGIDHLSPSTEGINIEPNSYPNDPYRDIAMQHAQEAGVMVHTILLGGAHYDEEYRGDIAQRNLDKLSDGSGGDSFSEDLQVMQSFAPYLNDMDATLHNQYLLTFTIDRSDKEKGEMRPIQLRTEQRGIDLQYQKEVMVPGPAH